MPQEFIPQPGQVSEPNEQPSGGIVDTNLMVNKFGLAPLEVNVSDTNPAHLDTDLREKQLEETVEGNTELKDGMITAKLDGEIATPTNQQKAPEPVKTAEPVQNQQTQVQQPNELQTLQTQWTEKENGYVARIQELEDSMIAIKEYEKDPIGFVTKNLPGFVLQHFQPDNYVESKIKEKYGEDFVYNEREAYTPRTPTYEYRKDVQRWENEAENTTNSAQSTISTQQQQADNLLQEKKVAVMSKYGMDEVTFNSKIWSPLNAMNPVDRLELLADAIMSKAGVKQMQTNIAEGTKVASNAPPSLSSLNSASGGETLDQNTKNLMRLFGANAQGARVIN